MQMQNQQPQEENIMLDLPTNKGSKKILVAEDDKFLINAYKLKFINNGFRIEFAFDGEEVFKMLKEHNYIPDLILLDLIMPNKDGFETLKELKAHQQYKNIPVIVLSNLSEKENVAKVKKLGAAEYLVKSNVSLDEIIERIKAIIG